MPISHLHDRVALRDQLVPHCSANESLVALRAADGRVPAKRTGAVRPAAESLSQARHGLPATRDGDHDCAN